MTPTERKERIRWILGHKVWGHPATSREVHLGNITAQTPDYDQNPYEHITFEYVHVDPATETIEDDDARNTAFRVWVEAGPPFDMRTDPNLPPPEGGWTLDNCWCSGHDLRLDCGAPTVEDALLKLADLVEQHYNEDGTEKPETEETEG